jgi:hypothetical protein
MIFSFGLQWLLLFSSITVASQFVEEDFDEPTHDHEQIQLNPGLDQTLDHVVYSSFVEPNSARHVAEKKRLLQMFVREEGGWTTNHPRYRLLQALHGFVRHKERYQTQLQGWQEEYDKLPDVQKKVSSSASTSPTMQRQILRV